MNTMGKVGREIIEIIIIIMAVNREHRRSIKINGIESITDYNVWQTINCIHVGG